MYITPPIQLPFDHSYRPSPKATSGLTFKGLPKYEPDVFDLRPDFNRTQPHSALNTKIAQDPGLRTIDYWA